MENLEMFLGKVVESVELVNDVLLFKFADGSKMNLWDSASYCCEYRYMTIDDDLSEFSGSKLVAVEVKDCADYSDDNGESHDVQFLEVMTNRGCFTIATHNEHNGYYGGFDVRISAVK